MVLARHFFVLKIEDIDDTCLGIYNPVFLYPGTAVLKKFYTVIHPLCGRGYDFYNPVWGAIELP